MHWNKNPLSTTMLHWPFLAFPWPFHMIQSIGSAPPTVYYSAPKRCPMHASYPSVCSGLDTLEHLSLHPSASSSVSSILVTSIFNIYTLLSHPILPHPLHITQIIFIPSWSLHLCVYSPCIFVLPVGSTLWNNMLHASSLNHSIWLAKMACIAFASHLLINSFSWADLKFSIDCQLWSCFEFNS